MNKIILLPVQPYWLYLIWTGKKKIEVRKREFLGNIYCVCSKKKSDLKKIPVEHRQMVESWFGKVPLMFNVSKVESMFNCSMPIFPSGYQHKTINDDLLKLACVTYYNYVDYVSVKNNEVCNLYALHIENLKIFDKPMELWQFYRYGSFNDLDRNTKFCITNCNKDNNGYCSTQKCNCDYSCVLNVRITKTPQSYCNAYFEDKKYV